MLTTVVLQLFLGSNFVYNAVRQAHGFVSIMIKKNHVFMMSTCILLI